MNTETGEASREMKHLVEGGNGDDSISPIESLIKRLDRARISSPSNQARSRELRERNQAEQSGDVELESKGNFNEPPVVPSIEASPDDDDDEEDWESLADHVSKEERGVSMLPLEDAGLTPLRRRRGRGSFMYTKNSLYSDQVYADALDGTTADGGACNVHRDATELRNSICGTSHVLVLSGFPSSTRTMDLENIFEYFKEQGFAIRWVNDILALAVFRSPSLALEALNIVRCPFKMYRLEENDDLLYSISARDLEPPYQRPKTSNRAARRMIAQGMGWKLPAACDRNEHKMQEEERRKMILMRQTMKDDAWGSD